MPAVVRVALALGLDGLLEWVIRLLLGLMIVGVIVAVIVVQTVAGILAGGRPGAETAASSTVTAQTAARVSVPTAAPVPGDGSSTVRTEFGSRVVQLAQAWLGVSYLFGGCSRAGVDCSCLVQLVYAAAGIHLPRVAVDQFNATVATNDPQPGDLVFFANTYEPGISHVGIYIGNGLQINAPTTNEQVSVAPVFTGYWGAHYAGARRAAD